jgi:hypothetical protein
MTRSELIRIVREELLDDVDDCLDAGEEIDRWSAAALLRWSGEAERQACRRGDLRHIFDDSTEAVCRLTLELGVTAYLLDPRVLRIDEVHRADGVRLEHTTRAGLDLLCPTWRTAQAGPPRAFFIQGRRLRLDRPPSAAEDGTVLSLSLWREPLVTYGESLTTDTAFELPHEIEPLKHWMAYEAFSVRDEDLGDNSQAAKHLALFERAYGPAMEQGVIQHKLEAPTVLRHHAGRQYFGDSMADDDDGGW